MAIDMLEQASDIGGLFLQTLRVLIDVILKCRLNETWDAVRVVFFINKLGSSS